MISSNETTDVSSFTNQAPSVVTSRCVAWLRCSPTRPATVTATVRPCKLAILRCHAIAKFYQLSAKQCSTVWLYVCAFEHNMPQCIRKTTVAWHNDATWNGLFESTSMHLVFKQTISDNRRGTYEVHVVVEWCEGLTFQDHFFNDRFPLQCGRRVCNNDCTLSSTCSFKGISSKLLCWLIEILCVRYNFVKAINCKSVL